MVHEIDREAGRVVAGAGDRGADAQHLGAVTDGDRLGGAEDQLRVGDAEDREDIGRLDLVAAVGDELVEGPERIAEAAVRRPRDRADGAVVDGDALRLSGTAQDDRDLVRRGAREVEALTTVDDGRHHLVGFRRREHEDRVRRRLLEGLQEGVPCFAGEHVGLVEDVDLPGPLGRRVADPLTKLADVVDRAVRGGVHLDHVHRAAVGDRDARLADATRSQGRAVDAVERAGEDLRHRGLARPARADEQVGVMDAIALDRVAEGANDMLLAHDLGERLRAMTPV